MSVKGFKFIISFKFSGKRKGQSNYMSIYAASGHRIQPLTYMVTEIQLSRIYNYYILLPFKV